MAGGLLTEACAVDRRIYLLFPASLRINILSQQIRALELVDALSTEAWMAGVTSIAVIGGGASGLTAAAALKNAGLRDELSITIFESRDQLMPLQSGCHDKMLAPRIIDWPADGSAGVTTEIPLLRWRKGIAAEVAIEMLEQFDRFKIDSKVGTKVTRVVEEGSGVVVHFEHGGTSSQKPFDMAIIAAGFGLEAETVGIANETLSYWRVNPEQAPALKGDAPKSILISGLGDGGLTDFVLFACPGLSHSRLCEQILSSPDVAPLMASIEQIEAGIWADPPLIGDIAAEYSGLNLDAAARTLILPWLVRDTNFTLLTHNTQLLSPGTSPLNRLAATLVMRAMHLEDLGTRYTAFVSATHLPDQAGESVWTEGGRMHRGRFDAVIIRHGDTSKNTWKFDNAAIDAKVAALRVKRAGLSDRPQAPILPKDVALRLEGRVLASQPTRMRLARPQDRVVWHSDLPVSEIGRLWRVPSAPVQIEIAFDPIGDDAKLDLALCRLLAHADPVAEIAGPHAGAWVALLDSIRASAGDRIRSPQTRVGTVLVDRNEMVEEADQLASTLEAALDQGLLALIDRRIRSLQTLPGHCPIHLHPDVIASALAQWDIWIAEAEALSSGNLRWVLKLFGGLLDGHGQPDPRSSVRVGPKCVEDELMPVILYHLIMRALVTGFAGPMMKPVGNVLRHDEHGEQMPASHFCGSRWFRNASGVPAGIDLWEKSWPGDAFAPSCLVLPARTAHFLPTTTMTGRDTARQMTAPPWDRVPIVFGSPELRRALGTGVAAAASALRAALYATLPDVR